MPLGNLKIRFGVVHDYLTDKSGGYIIPDRKRTGVIRRKFVFYQKDRCRVVETSVGSLELVPFSRNSNLPLPSKTERLGFQLSCESEQVYVEKWAPENIINAAIAEITGRPNPDELLLRAVQKDGLARTVAWMGFPSMLQCDLLTRPDLAEILRNKELKWERKMFPEWKEISNPVETIRYNPHADYEGEALRLRERLYVASLIKDGKAIWDSQYVGRDSHPNEVIIILMGRFGSRENAHAKLRDIMSLYPPSDPHTIRLACGLSWMLSVDVGILDALLLSLHGMRRQKIEARLETAVNWLREPEWTLTSLHNLDGYEALMRAQAGQRALA
jgi:hypothetical protein